ncbi:unnamed protein product [Leptosia nina]|uniref:Uncharacterized protein n=1 Tax=Leptosia nina TaxID=320188 RepID=A0AAV1JUG4_9NEOP
MLPVYIFFGVLCVTKCDDYYSKEPKTTEKYNWHPTESYWDKTKPTTAKDTDDKLFVIQSSFGKPYYVTGLYTIPYYIFGEFANYYQRPTFGYPDINYYNYLIKKQNKDKPYVPSYKP